MTVQLSKALTAETPEERRIETKWVAAGMMEMLPEALAVAALQEFMTNERTLFIDMARYGPRTASGSGQPGGKPIETAPKTAQGTAGAAPGPIDPEAVAQAIDALKLDASLWLHGPYFGRWMDLRMPDRYPADAVARLAALRALTLPQLEYLRTGQGRPPI